jgi:glutaredoxin 2
MLVEKDLDRKSKYIEALSIHINHKQQELDNKLILIQEADGKIQDLQQKMNSYENEILNPTHTENAPKPKLEPHLNRPKAFKTQMVPKNQQKKRIPTQDDDFFSEVIKSNFN